MIKQLDFITGSTKKCAEIARILTDIQVEQVLIDLPEIQEVDPHVIIRAKLGEALIHRPQGNFIIEDTSFYLEATPGLPGPLVKWFLETIGPKGIAHMAMVHADTRAVAKGIIGYCDAQKEIYSPYLDALHRSIRPIRYRGWQTMYTSDTTRAFLYTT